MNTARYPGNGGIGTQTAAVIGGGTGATAVIANSEEYDGTSYTEGNDLNTNRDFMYAAGTQTAGLGSAGYGTGNVETYDGSSWAEVNNVNTARYYGAGGGTQTAAFIAAGAVEPATINATTEMYDGTSWVTSATMGTARYRLGGDGTTTAAFAAGGKTTSDSNATEELTGETSAAEAADISFD